MRLAERVAKFGIKIKTDPAASYERRQHIRRSKGKMRQQIKQCVKLDASNICGANDDDTLWVKVRGQNVLVPYEEMFIEYQVNLSDQSQILGVFIEQAHVLDLIEDQEDCMEYVEAWVDRGAHWLQKHEVIAGPTNSERTQYCRMFPHAIVYGLDEHGVCVAANESTMKGTLQRPYDLHGTRVYSGHVFEFIKLFNCKNIHLDDESPGLARRRIVYRRRNEGMRYKILTRSSVSNGSRKRQSLSPNGAPVSLHIVAGHIRTYTEERPLFGKYVGQFYIPQHTRGDLEAGVSFTDYTT